MAQTQKLIYLDNAAATPLDKRVLAAMEPFFARQFYNPSATYLPAKEVKQRVEASRATVAKWLGVKPAEIYFTAGGTEANNLALHGIMQKYPNSNLVVSAIEHESVLKPAEKYKHKIATMLQNGIIDLEKLQKLIDDNTVLISVVYANNEIGTVQPIRKISELVKSIRKQRLTKGNTTPLYLHTDACQAGNYLDLHASRLGVDLMTINGGKIYGPKQSGALFVKAPIELEPQILGGGQEYGLRSGTENVAGTIGLAVALDIAQTSRQKAAEDMQKLQNYFFEMLGEHLPNAFINGTPRQRLPNNVHITLPGHDNERLLLQLESEGILASAGSACSASNEEPSHVLRAIGLTDEEARASLRFTMGRGTSNSDIQKTVKTLASFA